MRGLFLFAVVWTVLVTLWMYSKRIVEDKEQAYTDGAVMSIMALQRAKAESLGIDYDSLIMTPAERFLQNKIDVWEYKRQANYSDSIKRLNDSLGDFITANEGKDTLFFGDTTFIDSNTQIDYEFYADGLADSNTFTFTFNNYAWYGEKGCTLFCFLKSETLIIVDDSIADRRPIKKPEIYLDPNHGGAAVLYDKNGKRLN